MMEGQENRCLLDNTDHDANSKLTHCIGIIFTWLNVICNVTTIACLQAIKDLPPNFQMNTMR